MKTIILLFVLIIHSALASDCSEVNLVTEANSPFQKIPVYDQDGIGICYAYAASQLVDFQLIKSGKEPSTHPLWIALKYAEYKKNDKISSGMTYYAIEELVKAGNCEYQDISKGLAMWAEKAQVGEPQIMGLIEKFAPKIQAISKDRKPEIEEIDGAIQEAINEQKGYCDSSSDLESLIPELRSLGVLSSRKILSDLVLPVCNEKLKKLTLPDVKYFESPNDAGWGPQIQKKLDTFKAPVSISYCSNFLKSPEYDGITRKTKSSAEGYADDCAAHESILVGKKKIGESCHYLLRNSWGSGFSSATKNWKCLCKNRQSGEFLDDCTSEVHDNGEYTVEGCWVSESSLGKNIFGATTLDAKVKK